MLDFLAERYPHVAFQLSVMPIEPFILFKDGQGQLNAKKGERRLYGEDIAAEIREWRASLDLEGVEILYIYGLGLGHYYEPVKVWLKEKRERVLVFLEEDLSVFDVFVRSPIALDLLKDHQVHIYLMEQPKQWKAELDQIVHQFPCDKIVITALKEYAQLHPRRYTDFRLHLMRCSAAMDALFTDVLYAHRLFENLLPNMKKLSSSFFANRMKGSFSNIPAILCGAGPSLNASLNLLRQQKEKALLIAGGSAITALSSQGINPHLAIALDPNQLEYDRLENSAAFETPFLYAPRLCSHVFSLCNGPFGYLKTDTGGAFENWVDRKLGLEMPAIGPELGLEALSVMTIATAFAYYLGCNPIIFAGVDLAFTQGQRYAQGVVSDNQRGVENLKRETKAIDQLVKRKNKQGKMIHTLTKWIMESETLGAFAKHHPERAFFNASLEGLGFPGVPDQSLEELCAVYCGTSYDIKGLIRAEISRASILENCAIDIHLEALEKSLKRCADLCDQMLEELKRAELERVANLETGKMTILEMDLQEEIAFDALFQTLFIAMDRLAQRQFSFPDDPSYLREQLIWKKTKWEKLKEIIAHYKEVL